MTLRTKTEGQIGDFIELDLSFANKRSRRSHSMTFQKSVDLAQAQHNRMASSSSSTLAIRTLIETSSSRSRISPLPQIEDAESIIQDRVSITVSLGFGPRS